MPHAWHNIKRKTKSQCQSMVEVFYKASIMHCTCLQYRNKRQIQGLYDGFEELIECLQNTKVYLKGHQGHTKLFTKKSFKRMQPNFQSVQFQALKKVIWINLWSSIEYLCMSRGPGQLIAETIQAYNLGIKSAR